MLQIILKVDGHGFNWSTIGRLFHISWWQTRSRWFIRWHGYIQVRLKYVALGKWKIQTRVMNCFQNNKPIWYTISILKFLSGSMNFLFIFSLKGQFYKIVFLCWYDLLKINYRCLFILACCLKDIFLINILIFFIVNVYYLNFEISILPITNQSAIEQLHSWWKSEPHHHLNNILFLFNWREHIYCWKCLFN